VRNSQLYIGVSCRIIYPGVERPVRLEELRLKFDFALDINRADRRSKLDDFIHKFLLRRYWEVHVCLRAKPCVEKIDVMLDSNSLDRILCKICPFPGHLLFGGVQIPKRAADQYQYNDNQDNDLPG
jgi:hypothetical protein